MLRLPIWSIMPMGFNGRILRVDLTKRKSSIQELSESYYRYWFGGYGLGIRFAYSELEPHTDPLGLTIFSV